MVYQYSTTDRPPDDWDTDLTAPRDPNGGGDKYYGISHVRFLLRPEGISCP
jgi:hypothetical protein